MPERPFDLNELCRKIVISRNRGKRHNIIIKAEGVDISSAELARQVQEKTGKETKVVILSYLQRGGEPTMRDRLLATLCGVKAAELLADGGSQSKAIGTVNGRIVAYDLEEALQQKRPFDEEMYDMIGVLAK